MDTRKVIIIGSGPAGWAAATYASRAQLKPLVFAGERGGGQLMFTTEVENYPGFANGIMGPKLMMEMRSQAERFGAEIVDTNVTQVDFSKRPFSVWSGERRELAEAVILATGAESLMLNIPGEAEYLGRGVSTCAVCDAAFYKEKNVYVVGGGDAAMEDALALTKFAASITMVHRKSEFRASKIMQKRVLEDHKGKVEVLWNSEVVEAMGDGTRLTKIKIKNQNGEIKEVGADGLFLAIGHRPATEFLGGQVVLNQKGYVVTRLGLDKQSLELAQGNLGENGVLQFPTMTSVEGVFGGGDNVDFRYRQAITAAAMGTMAALDAEWWLERRDE